MANHAGRWHEKEVVAAMATQEERPKAEAGDGAESLMSTALIEGSTDAALLCKRQSDSFLGIGLLPQDEKVAGNKVTTKHLPLALNSERILAKADGCDASCGCIPPCASPPL